MALQIFSLCFISTEKMTEIQQWLDDPSKLEDLIVSASFIAGFEWPSVLIMTSHNYDAHFFVRNMVMRAMWRLVWLKTDIFDSIYERSDSVSDSDQDGTELFQKGTKNVKTSGPSATIKNSKRNGLWGSRKSPEIFIGNATNETLVIKLRHKTVNKVASR